MRKLFRFRYPKLFLLLVFSILSYYIFASPEVKNQISSLGQISYFGIFIAGMFFSFGFSTPFAIGFFLTLMPENIYLASFVGGLGAMLSDLFIFKIIRFSFMDEFKRLRKTKPIVEINRLLSTNLLAKTKTYLLFIFAGIILSSPLPDELGVSMLAGLTKIKSHILGIISFILNSIGIFLILLIGAKL